jgi:hypothetical protein
MRRLIRNLIPLSFFAIAALIHQFIPTTWGDRDGLVLIMALLGSMILLADMIEGSLGRVFNPYSHLWCFIIAPGTILHEVGHLTACKLTGTKVNEFRLFKPNPNTGQLGYVSFAFKTSQANWSVIKGLIIAMAPFFSGAVVLTGLLYLIAPGLQLPDIKIDSLTRLHEELLKLFEALKEGIMNDDRLGYGKYLAIYGIMVIGSGAAPSTTDFTVPFKQGARRWIGALFAMIFVILLGAATLFIPKVGHKLVSVLALAAACQFFTLGCVVLIRMTVGFVGYLFMRRPERSA